MTFIIQNIIQDVIQVEIQEIIVSVLSHGILVVLPIDGVLMLSQAMDCIVPGLPVVLHQDVGGSAHLTGDVVLHTQPGVGGAFQPRLLLCLD